ncbi:MAG: PLP-dependent aminotransferase family protein [Pelosinus sp.]|nr:PLP-dependent aminotransferase family protein [Pelosinus sp.]
MPVNSFEDYPMSWKPDFSKIKGPLYKAIAAKLEADIKNGLLTPGTKLPPQRELADFLDINLSTITRAFKLCEQKGVICATVGNGTFVASDAAANPYLLPEEDVSGIIEMGPLFPATTTDEIVAQLKKMISEPNFGKLFQYGRPGGTPWQKETGAKLLRKAGYDVNPENLLLTSGGQNAIAAILAGLFQPGDRIGTDMLTFPGLKTAANMLGIQLIPIQQKDNEITEAGLHYACKNENIKGIYVIPDYHNPTTHTMSVATRKRIALIAQKKHLIVIEDAIHSLLLENPLVPIAAYAPEQVLYISSLSKVASPGLRLAYMAVPKQYRKKLSEALYNMNISVSPIMAELASRIIISGAMDNIIESHRTQNRLRNSIVDRYLKNYKIMGEPDCIIRWLILPERFTGESFAAKAYQLGVQVYGAERFVVGNTKPTGAVRLAIAAPESLAKLEEAVKIIKKILDK